MSRCTWTDCHSEAKHEQRATDGELWGNLCDEHHALTEKRIKDALADPRRDNIRNLLGSWVKAQGGAKRAVRRVLRSKP